MNLGRADSLRAELIGVREGLRLALEMHIPSLIVELDALVVIQLLEGVGAENFLLKPLVMDCRIMIRQFLRCRLKHTYREGNGVADALARKGRELGKRTTSPDDPFVIGCNDARTFGDLLYFDFPPGRISELCFTDVSGVTIPRAVRTDVAEMVGD